MNQGAHAINPALSGKLIWITGASSGIGQDLALALTQLGNQVIISARSEDKLRHLAEQNPQYLIPLTADVTDLEQMRQAAEHIKQDHGKLDILIANAGTCEYLDVQAFDSALIQRVMDTNFMGLVHSIDAALPLLRATGKVASTTTDNNRPYIVGISSSATYLALPRAEAYGASKAAMNYFLESLSAELAHENIDISIVCPGFVKTPLTDLNNFPMPMRISSREASQQIIKGMTKRAREIHFPKRFTYLLKLLGALPGPLRHRLSRAMSRNEDAA